MIFMNAFLEAVNTKNTGIVITTLPGKKKIQNKTKQKLIGQSWSIKDHVC